MGVNWDREAQTLACHRDPPGAEELLEEWQNKGRVGRTGGMS